MRDNWSHSQISFSVTSQSYYQFPFWYLQCLIATIRDFWVLKVLFWLMPYDFIQLREAPGNQRIKYSAFSD